MEFVAGLITCLFILWMMVKAQESDDDENG
jgi:hypothetical protein